MFCLEYSKPLLKILSKIFISYEKGIKVSTQQNCQKYIFFNYYLIKLNYYDDREAGLISRSGAPAGGDSPETGLIVVEEWSHFQDPYKIKQVLEYRVGIELKNQLSSEIFVW